MRWGRALAALALLAGAPHAPASARPFTVEDLLQQESFGAVVIDPGGRWVVFERRGPYASAARFDDDQGNPIGTSRLFIAERAGAGPAGPLMPEAAAGQLIGALSPSGARLAVFQIHDGDWRVGVVELATLSVRWLDLAVPKPHRGRLLQWRSDEELLLVDRGGGPLTTSDRIGRVSAELLPRLWAQTAAGRGAHTVVGSGAYRDVRHARPPDACCASRSRRVAPSRWRAARSSTSNSPLAAGTWPSAPWARTSSPDPAARSRVTGG